MKIAVLGLGYVGTVSAACLAARGHVVIGVDLDHHKVDAISAGRSPVIEPGLDELVQAAVRSEHLIATADAVRAVLSSDISLVCVGTPSRENGALNLDHVKRVTQQIGTALREARGYHLVAYRSTMLPGTVENHLLPILTETSGKQPGRDFGVVMNPEFLREGSSMQDFNHPPRTVIGELDQRSGDTLLPLYADLDAPVARTSIKTAELVKYADNAFHALKITFANEIGNICKQEGIDGHELMDIFCLDTKLNLSPAYLKPAFAFGGSCLPKDLRALTYHARSHDVPVPLLQSVLASNEAHKERGFRMILRAGKRTIGILGLSFKPDTDDLRESPAVELAERLIGKGFEVWIYDRNVSLAKLVGTNRTYIEREIPHISSLMVGSLAEIQARAEILVMTTRDPEFSVVPRQLRPDQLVIDLVRIVPAVNGLSGYEGICW